MMAACPNCRSQVNDEQMFCRTCGFRLEPGFQISTHSLGLPSAGRLRISPTASQSGAACGANWRSYLLPIAGFMLALCFGGFTAAFFSDEPLPQLIVNSAPQLSERSYMGVYLINDNQPLGPVIDRMLEGSPAEQAGLHSGDRILAINGEEITTTYDVVSKLTAIAPAQPISVKVQRNNSELYFSLNTARRNDLNMQSLCTHEGFLGVGDLDTSSEAITVRLINSDMDAERQQTGVRIGMVVEKSAADIAGLQADDLILDIDNTATHTTDELSRTVRGITPGQSVNIRILRDGELINVIANMGSRN